MGSKQQMNKIKPLLLGKQKTEKIAPSFEMPAKSKTRLKATRHCRYLLLSSIENYTCLVLNVCNMHALYT